MMKFYTKKTDKILSPKLSTIRFLLDYSKSFHVVKTTKTNYPIELHLN